MSAYVDNGEKCSEARTDVTIVVMHLQLQGFPRGPCCFKTNQAKRNMQESHKDKQQKSEYGLLIMFMTLATVVQRHAAVVTLRVIDM